MEIETIANRNNTVIRTPLPESSISKSLNILLIFSNAYFRWSEPTLYFPNTIVVNQKVIG